MSKKAMQQALEALQNIDKWLYTIGQNGLRDYEADAATALRDALAQSQEQKPQIAFNAEVVGYVAPQRVWVGLTDEERQDIALEVPIDAVFITEAKLKEKNT